MVRPEGIPEGSRWPLGVEPGRTGLAGRSPIESADAGQTWKASRGAGRVRQARDRTRTGRRPAAAPGGAWLYSGAAEGYAGANARSRLYGTEGNRLRRGRAVFRGWTERWLRSGPRIGCGRIGTLGRRPKIQEAATCVGGPGGSGQSTGRESAR